jgi:hypothetical protein
MMLAPETRSIVRDMLASDRYRRRWPDPTHLFTVGGVLLEAHTLYMATRMVRDERTPAAKAGEPMWTAWTLAVALNEDGR